MPCFRRLRYCTKMCIRDRPSHARIHGHFPFSFTHLDVYKRQLTRVVFEVNGIHHSEIENAKLVEYAALAESASSHPISKSLQKAYGKPIDRGRVKDIQEISGNGVIATVDGRQVAAGNGKLMDLSLIHIFRTMDAVRPSAEECRRI